MATSSDCQDRAVTSYQPALMIVAACLHFTPPITNKERCATVCAQHSGFMFLCLSVRVVTFGDGGMDLDTKLHTSCPTSMLARIDLAQ